MSAVIERSPSLPNEDRITRLMGAVLLEANDEWQHQHRTMHIEGMAELATPQLEETTPLITPPPHDRWPPSPTPQTTPR